MRGRFVHQPDGSSALQPYGQRPSEVIYSISRHRLNQALIEVALRQPQVDGEIRAPLGGCGFRRAASLTCGILRRDRVLGVPMRPLIATDGAGSLMRHRMAARGLIEARECDLEHGYKELSIPAGPQGNHLLTREALHIWPRGDYMLIALAERGRQLHRDLVLAQGWAA